MMYAYFEWEQPKKEFLAINLGYLENMEGFKLYVAAFLSQHVHH